MRSDLVCVFRSAWWVCRLGCIRITTAMDFSRKGTAMADGVLLFNRDAVGIKGNQMWTDNQMFVNIGNGIGKLAGDSGRAVAVLPVDGVGGGGKTDNDGTSALRSELTADVQTVARMAMEMSDACAVLGSGAQGAVEDMDAAESKVTADFEFMMSAKPRH